MNLPADTQFLVFTDLDGSLLDHHTYSYLGALPQLHLLEHLGIPVIPVTSKTRLEIEHLRAALGNSHPFVVENGAAVFIPVGYFATQPVATVECEGYWVREFSAPRDKWLGILEQLSGEFSGEYDYFFRAGTAGVARMTNLSEAGAAQANQREYSEPVQWLGDQARKAEFISRLQSSGASVLQGGRFLAVSGDCDKGRALAWLRQLYQQSKPGIPCHDLAIGDSGNDCAMLEAAETALLVRSPVHKFPALQRADGMIFSTDYGPAGWAEGVACWLHSYQLPE
ncbi:MAG: mannosyl-3-phosphoglycerate phosphatase [Gammaproteobacteria bacterium]|nr:MAG: mannosyl-3-phosphoglycerate phosphatase [Gammaproteobacteria bacterium]RLA61229.1 MAG: mannosyl-3-phosphoglycerate phosphatase [Gammaproteobacteria bacterium]